MMQSRRTNDLGRRAAENAAMAALMATTGLLLKRMRVQDVVTLSEQVADTLSWASVITENTDTLARGQALAYRWSVIPGCSCLHRAVATRVWLGAFRMKTRVILGLRKRDEIEGHAWLEVYLGDVATLLFVDDDDGYEAELAM